MPVPWSTMLPGNPENVTKGKARLQDVRKCAPPLCPGTFRQKCCQPLAARAPASRTQAALTNTALFTGPDGTRLRFERRAPRCSPVPLRTPQPSPDAELARGSPAAARLAARLARPPPGPPARDAGQACWTRARRGRRMSLSATAQEAPPDSPPGTAKAV